MSWERLSGGHWPDFESRQRQWAGFRRHFRQHHGRGEVRVWEIWYQDGRVFTNHGQFGGAMQGTSYVGKVKNKGKANEVTAEQDALAEARRDIRKKWDFEGYDEYAYDPAVRFTKSGNGTADVDHWINIDRRNQDISIPALLTSLPGSFVLYKPENNLYDQKRLLEKANKGQVVYTLKRDGLAYWAVVDFYGNVQLYSRRSRAWSDTEEPVELQDGTLDYSKVVLWSQRFPHIVEAIRSMNLPKGTMLAGELVAPGKDSYPYVLGLSKGHTPRALEDMTKNGLPLYYWWDVPFFDGEDLVSTKTPRHRWKIIEEYIGASNGYVVPLQFSVFGTPEDAVAHAKSNGIEGWVVVDPDEKYGDRGWNLKGKPDRPKTCAKLKPWFEDDFIAYWDPDNDMGEWGTGRHEKGKRVKLPSGLEAIHGGVGSVMLYQYNSDGQLIPICKCATGMDYEFQAQLRKEHFPMVVEAQYAERTYIKDGEKTNALRLPKFVRVRTDKQIGECINPRL